MPEPRVNPMTVTCDYCGATERQECIQRGTRDQSNNYRGRRLRPGIYHDTRITRARELVTTG